ncbi:hypothetical protein C8Q75DRAFT_746111 [Abortiporus biennis]|nr:hypothetical protein C8Q75DRAFT_746111 [Abortiporus biennis]
MFGAVAARYPLIASRAPSIILFTTLELSFAGFVWSQWRQPSLIPKTSFKSAIPAAHLQRRHASTPAYA